MKTALPVISPHDLISGLSKKKQPSIKADLKAVENFYAELEKPKRKKRKAK